MTDTLMSTPDNSFWHNHGQLEAPLYLSPLHLDLKTLPLEPHEPYCSLPPPHQHNLEFSKPSVDLEIAVPHSLLLSSSHESSPFVPWLMSPEGRFLLCISILLYASIISPLIGFFVLISPNLIPRTSLTTSGDFTLPFAIGFFVSAITYTVVYIGARTVRKPRPLALEQPLEREGSFFPEVPFTALLGCFVPKVGMVLCPRGMAPSGLVAEHVLVASMVGFGVSVWALGLLGTVWYVASRRR